MFYLLLIILVNIIICVILNAYNNNVNIWFTKNIEIKGRELRMFVYYLVSPLHWCHIKNAYSCKKKYFKLALMFCNAKDFMYYLCRGSDGLETKRIEHVLNFLKIKLNTFSSKYKSVFVKNTHCKSLKIPTLKKPGYYTWNKNCIWNRVHPTYFITYRWLCNT